MTSCIEDVSRVVYRIQSYISCNFPMTVQPMAAVDTEKLHSLQSQRHYHVTVETNLANTPYGFLS